MIRNNRFFQSGTAHFIAGERFVFEDNVIEGGAMARGGGDYRNRVYYARNTVGMMSLADGEGFTTDGGGNAPVKLASCDGTRVRFDRDLDWRRWTHNGTGSPQVCIIDGAGAGQSRKLVSFQGRAAEMERPGRCRPTPRRK